MWDDASKNNFSLGIEVVIAFVEAKMLGASRPSWSSNDDAVEDLANEPLVMYVGTSNTDRERDAAAICQDVPFDALLGAIRRVWTCVVPPFGAFTEALSSDVHFQSIPRFPS